MAEEQPFNEKRAVMLVRLMRDIQVLPEIDIHEPDPSLHEAMTYLLDEAEASGSADMRCSVDLIYSELYEPALAILSAKEGRHDS